MQKPQGKVLQQADDLFLPSLVWEHRRLPLGRHASEDVAQAVYDIAKLLLVRKLGGEGEPFERLKLHSPAAVYTSHPLWQQLSSRHCSFEEACSLLAGGAAEELLAASTGCRELRHKRPAAGAAAAAQQQSKRPRQEPCCARCGSGSLNSTLHSAGQQRLCTACSGALQGQLAAVGAAAQRSGDGSGSAAARADQSARAPAAGQTYRRQTSWSGLEPIDCGTYCLRLSRSVAEGKCSAAGMPTRYARPVFVGAAAGLDLPTSVTLVLAGSDRQFRCGLTFTQRTGGYSLSGMRLPVRALGAAAGDLVCFAPAGHGTATISLRKAGAQAAAAPGSNGRHGVAGEAAVAADADGNKGQAAGPQQAEKTDRQRALLDLFADSD